LVEGVQIAGFVAPVSRLATRTVGSPTNRVSNQRSRLVAGAQKGTLVSGTLDRIVMVSLENDPETRWLDVGR
jgi:hypothetical protein